MPSIANHSCHCCGSEMRRYNKIKDGIVLACSGCNSLKLLKENITSTAAYGISYSDHLDHNKAMKLFNTLSTFIQPGDKKNTLLDIGCGDGSFLAIAQKNGWHASGIDTDMELVKIVQKKNLNCQLGELGKPLKHDHKYDVITLWDLIEHVEDTASALDTINELIKMNGKLVILTPDADSVIDSIARTEKLLSFGLSQRLNNLCLNRYHLHRFTKKGLMQLLEKNGYNIVTMKSVRMFSLEAGSYFDDFVPGINRLSKNGAFNRLLSKAGYSLLKLLRIKNKIFCIAEYRGKSDA